ncbi:peroxidase family protein [Glycomyces mayteni]|uniref:Peroxidase family protein n=1 Tax=Glycomyces mayteni TaxID=543887 RepID=A0ABW2D994_9ACTN
MTRPDLLTRRAAPRPGPLRRSRRRGTVLKLAAFALVFLLAAALAVMAEAGGRGNRPARPVELSRALPFDIASLDGTGNNEAEPDWGAAGQPYQRLAPAAYADGVGAMQEGPDPRYVSNRVFADDHVNLFSERGLSQWNWAWGQFVVHNIALRRTSAHDDPAAEAVTVPFDNADPLEEFTNDAETLPFLRSVPAEGTGVDSPREQVDLLPSYLGGFEVYGGTEDRLEWLRDGEVNGDLADNAATFMLDGGYLPTADLRGDAAAAPYMDASGRLTADPAAAMVTGDVRANQSPSLLALSTLFAREHNRIVAELPRRLTDEAKFAIARRVVVAEIQRITYEEFLPALGVELPDYEGYDPDTRVQVSNEFATVAFRAHSMIHGDFLIDVADGYYTDEELEAFEAAGLEVEAGEDGVEAEAPAGLMFFNPDLFRDVGLEAFVHGMSVQTEYNNDEMVDNQLRSVLNQVPVGDATDCLDSSECFTMVTDLPALDLVRARDHGLPGYNALREAFGLEPAAAFTDITGEDTEALPEGLTIDSPEIMAFTAFADADGNPVTEEEARGDGAAVSATRASTLAARLAALYGDTDSLDAITGMMAEPHLPGSEFGELQQAMWAAEFTMLRDGDRFFYRGDEALDFIADRYDVEPVATLAELITGNTGIGAGDLQDNVFFAAETAPLPAAARDAEDPPARGCHHRQAAATAQDRCPGRRFREPER